MEHVLTTKSGLRWVRLTEQADADLEQLLLRSAVGGFYRADTDRAARGGAPMGSWYSLRGGEGEAEFSAATVLVPGPVTPAHPRTVVKSSSKDLLDTVVAVGRSNSDPFLKNATEIAELSVALGIPLPASCYPYGKSEVAANPELQVARLEAADAALNSHVFEPYRIVETEKWKYNEPCSEWHRKVHLENGGADKDNLHVDFNVVFVSSDSAEIHEAYAFDPDTGNDVGKPGDAGSTPSSP